VIEMYFINIIKKENSMAILKIMKGD